MNDNEEIVEKKEKDGSVFSLFADGKKVCGAETEAYSFLLDIKTTEGEERKGYAAKLLSHIEKLAKDDNAKKMQTDEIDPYAYEAVCFFKSMGYELKPIEGDVRGFLEGKKNL